MAQLKAGTTIGGRDIVQEFDSHKVETVQQSVHGLKTMGNITLYVDATNGNNNNPGTQSQPLKTIGAAVAKITNLVIDYGHTITIQLAPGTYTENIYINNLCGAGTIYLKGGNSLSEADNYVIDGFVWFTGCTCLVWIYGIKIKGSASRDGAVIIDYCSSVRISNCKIDKSGRIYTANYGIIVGAFSSVWIADNDISNIAGGSGGSSYNVAIMAWETSRVYSRNNSGSNNGVGLKTRAGTIMKYGTQPSGTTAEVVEQGGVIR